MRDLKLLHRNQTIITGGSAADYLADADEMPFDFGSDATMASSWPATQAFVLDCIAEHQQYPLPMFDEPDDGGGEQRSVRPRRPTSLAIAGRQSHPRADDIDSCIDVVLCRSDRPPPAHLSGIFVPVVVVVAYAVPFEPSICDAPITSSPPFRPVNY